MDNTEFIGFTASAVIALVVFIGSNKISVSEKGYRRAISLSLAFLSLLLGGFITSHLNMRNQLEHITSKQFVENLKANESAQTLADNCVLAQSHINSLESKFFEGLLSRRIDRVNNTFSSLSQSEINYQISEFNELGELQADVMHIFRSAPNTIKIRATSYVNIDQWWIGSFGEQYFQENLNALDRGVEVERVFIFSGEEDFNRLDNQQLMTFQKKSGIKVYHVMFADIEQFVEEQIDIILVGQEYFGVLHLIERKMKRFTLSTDKDRLEKLHYYWTNILSVATEF